jgi:hypothetical protein
MSHEFDKPLTVGDLKEILANLPDNMQILTSSIPTGAQSDWYNINTIAIPTRDFENGFSAVTLFLSDSYDPRQF